MLVAGDVDYDSLDEGAPSPSEDLIFDVGGGGPIGTATAAAGSVLINASTTAR